MICKKCGSEASKYVRKDVAHVGEYCATCGAWKKWISKAEQAGKTITDGVAISTENTQTVKGYSNSTCMAMSDIPSNMASREPDLQVNIAPRGVAVITVSDGETLELTNVTVRVNRNGVTICDVAGNQVKTYRFN